MLTSSSALRPAPSVLFQPLEDGGVLFCTRSEVYFSLNPVGVEIWDLLLKADRDLDGLVGQLRERYPQALPETLRDDVRVFLAELSSAGLLES
jgi:hypothetical protein